MDLTRIDFQFWLLAFQACHLIITGVLGVIVWLSGRQRVTMARITELEEKIDARMGGHVSRMDGHGTRLTCLESDVRHMPTQTDLANLSTQISRTNGLISELGGRLTGINRAVDLINEFLIKRGDKTDS